MGAFKRRLRQIYRPTTSCFSCRKEWTAAYSAVKLTFTVLHFNNWVSPFIFFSVNWIYALDNLSSTPDIHRHRFYHHRKKCTHAHVWL